MADRDEKLPDSMFQKRADVAPPESTDVDPYGMEISATISAARNLALREFGRDDDEIVMRLLAALLIESRKHVPIGYPRAGRPATRAPKPRPEAL